MATGSPVATGPAATGPAATALLAIDLEGTALTTKDSEDEDNDVSYPSLQSQRLSPLLNIQPLARITSEVRPLARLTIALVSIYIFNWGGMLNSTLPTSLTPTSRHSHQRSVHSTFAAVA